MRVIGVIGGVGSGKSYIADLLETEFKAFQINMDKIAHKLMEKGEISYVHIVDYFGDEILREDKEIDRRKLGAKVYQHAELLKKLNSFIHPYVLECTRKLLIQKEKEKQALVCIETALPEEAHIKEFCQEVWYVHTPREMRIERLKKNRQYDNEKIEGIIKNQIKEEAYKKFSTHVLINDYPRDRMIREIEFLLVKKKDI